MSDSRDDSNLRIIAPATGLRRLKRSDIVVRRGQLTLLNDILTPVEAGIEDLLAVADALTAAGIDFLLVRGLGARLILAVDRRERRRVATALASAFVDEPFYSKAGSEHALFIADGKLSSNAKARSFRLYRPRIDSAGRLRYGAASAMQLEFWDFGDEEIVAPAANAVMRTRLPREEARDAVVERFGREWRTLQGMFDPLASDIDFPIDIVFSWVDGSSAEFQRMRALRMQSYVVGVGDDSAARYRQLDELKYALRSVHLFAPWIRHIFIVTDSPTPSWLIDHEDVTIVPSSAFFRDPSDLPTHNSHAIESQLQHIEGLSEHFIYSNDDMFFGRPTSPDAFFSPGGITKFVESTTPIGLGSSSPQRSGYENAARVNRRILREKFGRVTTHHLEHAPTPLRRSVLLEMEQVFADDFARTAASPFRSETDISVTNSFYHYYALMTGRAVVQTNVRVMYIETTLRSSLRQMTRLLRDRRRDFFCLNDGSEPEISIETRTQAVLAFLNSYFPIPAPWERLEELPVGGSVTPTQESASS